MHRQRSTFWTHLVPALLLPYAVLMHIHNTFPRVECRWAAGLKRASQNFKWKEGKKNNEKDPKERETSLLHSLCWLAGTFVRTQQQDVGLRSLVFEKETCKRLGGLDLCKTNDFFHCHQPKLPPGQDVKLQARGFLFHFLQNFISK